MVVRNAGQGLDTVAVAPLLMGYGFERTLKVTGDVAFIERIIDRMVGHAFRAVEIIAERDIETGVRDMLGVEWRADNVAAVECLSNLFVAKYCHKTLAAIRRLIMQYQCHDSHTDARHTKAVAVTLRT